MRWSLSIEAWLEDWVMPPAPDEEISARAAALLKRLRLHGGQDRLAQAASQVVDPH
ncbi:MAG: hypothetical protein ACYCZV_11690 [Acidimicrobiales bacterium]